MDAKWGLLRCLPTLKQTARAWKERCQRLEPGLLETLRGVCVFNGGESFVNLSHSFSLYHGTVGMRTDHCQNE